MSAVSKEPYDLVILGGGINGAGMARDAALRGLRVAMFDKDDFGSGTSSKSSKLIHGGLRYLEHGEFGLVFESVNERAVQRKVAPHLVRPLPFLVPVYEDAKPGLGLMNIGLWIYDTLALFRAPKMHRTFRGEKAANLEPHLISKGLKGAIEYYDCVTDDARLVLENVVSAVEAGADCRSHTAITAIERAADGKVEAVRIRDVLTGEEDTVPTRCLVVAAGAWTDEVNEQVGVGFDRKLLRRTKGVHIVFPRDKLPLRRAVTLISQKDGRVMFAIPWKNRTVIGTTDTDFEGTADDCHADAADVAYLCAGANEYFPECNFEPKDVIATWSGLRPLISDGSESTGAVSREHQIYVRVDGTITIAGGKLTTYRRMAKECVRKAIKWLKKNRDDFDPRKLKKPRTKDRSLPGGIGLPRQSMTGVQQFAHKLTDDFGLDTDVAHHLAITYGGRAIVLAEAIASDPALGARMQDDPDMHYVWAEVGFAVTKDLARTVTDVLARRVPLLLVGRNQGLDVLDEVAARVQTALGLSDEAIAAQVAEYREVVAHSRQFHAK